MKLVEKLQVENKKKELAKEFEEEIKRQAEKRAQGSHSCSIPLFFSNPDRWNDWLENCMLQKLNLR